jgi:hypothetical protein
LTVTDVIAILLSSLKERLAYALRQLAE